MVSANSEGKHSGWVECDKNLRTLFKKIKISDNLIGQYFVLKDCDCKITFSTVYLFQFCIFRFQEHVISFFLLTLLKRNITGRRQKSMSAPENTTFQTPS